MNALSLDYHSSLENSRKTGEDFPSGYFSNLFYPRGIVSDLFLWNMFHRNHLVLERGMLFVTSFLRGNGFRKLP